MSGVNYKQILINKLLDINKYKNRQKKKEHRKVNAL